MNVRTICLSILYDGEATGYEIRKLSVEGEYSYFIDASYGAIYPALQKLEADKFVTSRVARQDGRPSKKIYSITELGRREFINSLFDKLADLLPFDFKWTIGSADFGAAKPDPALFRHAIEQCGHDAERILFVGDSIRLDVAPAREVGMQSVLIDRHGLFPYFGEHRITSLHQMDRYWSDAS